MSRLPLHVFTLCLDSMPWLACIFAELNRLEDIPWTWVCVEGAAMNVKDTAWCAPTTPRLSSDGTSEFLDAIAHHPRIKVVRRKRWEGKTEMCNAALEFFTQPGVLLQVDSDELHTCDQLRQIVQHFEDDATLGRMAFPCRYYTGSNIVTTDTCDWWRAWRFEPGDRFATHEPPVMQAQRGRAENHIWTGRLGLGFHHYSWALPKHVAAKERYYGARYKGALDGWERLQRHPHFPTKIKPFFPWSAAGTVVDRVFKD